MGFTLTRVDELDAALGGTKLGEHRGEIRDAFLRVVEAAGRDPLVFEAIRWAAELHAGVDKVGRPYLRHLSTVAATVIDVVSAPSVELLCAAILHDSLEDCGPQLAERAPTSVGTVDERAQAALATCFGASVAAMVSSLSHAALERGLSDDEVISSYERYFASVLAGGDGVAAIKIADFSTNALHLNDIADVEKRTWLRRKYAGPLRLAITHLEERGGARTQRLLATMRRAWETDFSDLARA